MRRVSTNYVKPGMVLGRAVYDSGGYVVLESGSSLDAESLAALKIGGVGEVFIHDDRLLDVPVSPMFPPELEGQVTQGMTQLITESQGESRVQDGLIQFLTAPLYGMIRVLFPEPLGEINAGGCLSADDFRYAQPVKVAGLSLLMGKRLGYGISELASLGMAALLKDVGYNVLPQGIADGPQSSEEGELGRVREHPSHGAKILAQSGDFDPEVIRGVLQHHERWDGGGYPGGLKGPDISSIAGIVSIADSYYELVSVRPWKPALMPHEAVEYIMAYSGEMFDPEMVRLFARQAPLYPAGIIVQLTTGEIAFVTDANVGHIGRPIVRICYDGDMGKEGYSYDVDLSDPKHQDQLIAQVLEY